MNKILKQSGKKPITQKTKDKRIAEKTQLLSARLTKQLNNLTEVEDYDTSRT